MEVPENDDLCFVSTEDLIEELRKRFDVCLIAGVVWHDDRQIKHQVAIAYTETMRALGLADIAKARILDDYKASQKLRRRKRRKDDEWRSGSDGETSGDDG